MGLFGKVFGPKAAKDAAVFRQQYQTLSAYSPIFSTRSGAMYETELVRAAIHAGANQASKLKPEVLSDLRPTLKALLPTQPNPLQSTSQFLYRLWTILENETTAPIIPLMDPTGTEVTGYWAILPQTMQVVDVEGEPWVVYSFGNGQSAAVEFSRVGFLTKFQYRDDIFGGGNSALSPTLDLLDIQRQGMTDAVKSAANLRFIGRLNGQIREEDIKKKRDAFGAEMLSSENASGLALYDNSFADLKQIEAKPYIAEAEQMKLIKDSVFSYFGVNEDILQNKYDEDTWGAFYEGKIEPFALQLSLALSNMTFSQAERLEGNKIIFSANRLQYASNQTKATVTTQLVDRGIMALEDAADVFNIAPREEGDGKTWVIRGEYIPVENLPAHTVDNAKDYLGLKPPTQGGGDAGKD